MSPVLMPGLDGRVALVTGAARGIGQRVVGILVDSGARVAASDVATPPAPPNGIGLAIDVTSDESVDAGIRSVEERLGTVQILVLNAGILRMAALEEHSAEVWADVIDTNLTGAFRCARRCVPQMARTGWGRVIAIGSSAGKNGGSVPAAAYASSKAGVMCLMRNIAREYAGYGVTANAVAPSYIATDMIAGIVDAPPIPVGRIGTPDDVAWAVAFLASAHSSYITAEIVNVTGGILVD